MTSQGKRGFTLIELAIIAVVSGLLLAGALRLYQTYTINDRYRSTVSRLNIIYSSLDAYSISEGRLPFPADPTLPLSSPDAGCECGSCNDTATACSALQRMPFGCSPSGGICKASGSRSTPVNPSPAAGNDPVYSGAVPYKTIRNMVAAPSVSAVAMDDMLDSWNYQTGYAVSAAATDKITFRQGVYGVINVTTENGVDLTNPAGSVNFIIISYGDNHMGAYTAEGKKSEDCVGGMTDYENCNRDYKFISGLRALHKGSDYFDDIVQYSLPSAPKLWDFTASGSNNVRNRNAGNIGIGVPPNRSPSQALEVNGTIHIANGGAYVSEICDLAGAGCWRPNLLAGPISGSSPSNNMCAGGAGMMNVVTGLTKGKVDCKPLPLVAAVQSQFCPAGHFAIGFSQTAGLLCH